MVTGLTMLGTMVSSSVVGYAFATLPGRGKNILFGMLLATIMVPAPVTLIPLFILFSKLGWVNSYLPLVVPHFFANAFYVFLFRQFFLSLPPDLFESAELDGCNPLTAYWYIALPLSRPALAVVGVFAFIGAWNDFLGPLIYLSTNDKFTLSLGLSLFQGLYYTQLQYLMPMSLVALLPVLVIYFAAQRYFVQGIVTTGLNG
jgi:multiple sugar transport system permease protein